MNDPDLTLESMMVYAIQDEYHARAEYAAIMDAFGDKAPYSNILLAEEAHIASLTTLFHSLNMEVPDDDSTKMVVIPSSLLEAAQTGVQAEIDNIAMYNIFLNQELPDEVKTVFTQLRDASENHLAAFQQQVERLS